MTGLATSLPITRLHFSARVEQPLQLPPFAGSMLRGALGHALLALSPLPHVDGQRCALHATCPYCQFFAAAPLAGHSLQQFSQMPQPYVMEPPSIGARSLRAGQSLDFSLVLIGKALALAGVAVQALERALRTGLGDTRSRCTLVEVRDAQGVAWTTNAPLVDLPPAGPLPAGLPTAARAARAVGAGGAAGAAGAAEAAGTEGAAVSGASLRFLTPLRLQVQGKVARVEHLRARDLLIALARRHQLLLDMHLGKAAPQHDFAALGVQAAAVELESQDLRWFDCGRFSQRQLQEVRLGGLVGSLMLRGDLAPFAEMLHLGQWLHVGKTASFGLGRYELVLS